MAVIEIAKIQVRRGQERQTGIPRLDGGEFAWAADTEQLYIGLKIEDGGSRDANVRILTENDERNFFALGVTSSTYTYRLGTLITAPNGFTEEFERTVQEKLDDFVSITDFGATGDGVNDETSVIQTAIDRLFLDTMDFEGSTGRHPGKTLYFPAGTYNITATIYIPRYTTIVGEGIDKTVFNVVSTATHAFQTCDYMSQKGTAGYITFDNTTTFDSGYAPDGIHMQDMTIKFDSTLSSIAFAKSLVSIDCADDAVLRRIKFRGWHSPGDNVIDDYTGVDIRGFEAVTSENVLIDNCQFLGLYHGVRSNHDILNPIIQNSEFFDSVRGVSFNSPKDLAATIGPRFGKILNNRFENIEEQGIYAGSANSNTGTYHLSQNNTFLNVGNYFNVWGERSSTGTSIISFLSGQNSSVNDHFDRYDFQMTQQSANATYNGLIEGYAAIENSFVSTSTLYDNSSTAIVRLPITGLSQQIQIRYNAFEDAVTDRMGVVTITVREGANPATVITDDYTYDIGPGSLGWIVNTNPGYKYLEVLASNSSGANLRCEHQTKIMI